MESHYRTRVRSKDLLSFHILIKETDLWVSAERDLTKETEEIVFNLRFQIESYIQSHADFLTTLEPYPIDPFAPDIIQEMINRTRDVGIGPMAAVAGAIAQETVKELLQFSRQVVVENGGDIYLTMNHPARVAIHAGQSPLSQKLGLLIPPDRMPLGICTSSGKIGHSLSMGKADAVCLVSPSAYLADATATALGNRVKGPGDLEAAIAWARNIEGIHGGVVLIKDKMATWGNLELTILD